MTALRTIMDFKLAGKILLVLVCASFLSCATAPPPLPPLTETELKILQMIGGELLPDGNIRIDDITIHRREKEISFPAKINMTSGPIEVLISTSRGRVHEALLSTKTDPFKIQLALILLGAENGARIAGKDLQQGTLIDVFVLPEGGVRVPVEDWIFNTKMKKPMDRNGWVFVGSSFESNGNCLASQEGNVINTWSSGNTILDNPDVTGDNDDELDVYAGHVPEYQTPVTVFMGFRKNNITD